MECLMCGRETLYRVLEIICSTRGGDKIPPLPDIPQLNGSVFQFYVPADDGVPEVEVIFLHGIQQHGDSPRAHLTTWTSMSYDGSKSFYWPLEFLAKEFPRARLLSVSYDSSITRESKFGSGVLDLYQIAENLRRDLTTLHRSGCPVVLVGQDVGGLVIKALCIKVSDLWRQDKECEFFIRDIKCIMYYCTPHLGFERLPSTANGAFAKGLGLLDVKTARLNEAFRKIRGNGNDAKWKRWKTMQLATPSVETEFGFSEGTLRNGYVDDYYTDGKHDLHSISKPQATTDPAYYFLRGLIQEAIAERELLHYASHASTLLFEHDKKYVPMKETMMRVWEAIEDSEVKGVLLHGDAGTGKSSLARHFAVSFEKENAAKMGPCQNDNTPSVVCFVSCGFEASIDDIQDQLLSYFKEDWRRRLNDPVVTEKQRIREKHRTLVERLRGLHAVLILDDVYDSELLENIWVPGDNLKYLVTTRDADLWYDEGWRRIPMQPLDLTSALQILANYAQFKDRRVPQHFEVQAREIVEEVHYHPLAVATVGAVLQKNEDLLEAHEWSGLKEYLDTGKQKIVNSGRSYPMSVSKALMLMVDGKFLDEDAMNLLYILNLFQGPLILESVVKSFLLHFQPTALKSFDPNIDALEARGLVQFVWRPRPEKSLYVWLSNSVTGQELRLGRAELGGESGETEYRTVRVFVLHDLFQQFILEKKGKEMDALARSLESLPNGDWPTLLIACFGITKGSEVREKAKTRGAFSNHAIRTLQDILSVSLGTIPMVLNGELQNRIFTTCTEVLRASLVNVPVDDETILHSLEEQASIEWTCTVVGRILSSRYCRRAASSPVFQSGVFLDEVLNILADSEEMVGQLKVLYLLAVIVDGSSQQELHKLLSTGELLRTIISGNFLSKDKGWISFLSARVTAALVKAPSNAAMAVEDPHFVHILMGLLSERVDADQQVEVLGILNWIVDHEGTRIFSDPATDSHALLQRITTILSQDVGEDCKISFHLVSILASALLQKIKTILSQGPGEVWQTSSHLMMTSADVPDFADPTEYLDSRLDKLVLLFGGSVQYDLQFKLLEAVYGALDAAPRLAGKILKTPGCLVKLLGLLASNVRENLQILALETLLRLYNSADTSGELREVFLKKLETTNVLQQLNEFLLSDIAIMCEISLALIAKLASAFPFAEKIVKTHGCLENLSRLLANNVEESLQTNALRALLSLTRAAKRSDSSIMEMLETETLLDRIETFLLKDFGERCKVSMLLMAELTKMPHSSEIIVMRCSVDDYLSKLVKLLDDNVSEDIHIVALQALWLITAVAKTSQQHGKIYFRKLEATNILQQLNEFLLVDMGPRCSLSALLIANGAGALTFAEKFFETPGCVDNLLRLLADDVAESLQATVLAALHNMTSSARQSDFVTKMLASKAVFEKVIKFFPKDFGRRCEFALKLFANLVQAPCGYKIFSKSYAARYALDQIEKLLDVDELHSLAFQALRAISAAAEAGTSTQGNQARSKMPQTTNALQEINQSLSTDNGRRCEEADRGPVARDPHNSEIDTESIASDFLP